MSHTSARPDWGDSPAVLVVDVSRKRADPALDTSVPSVTEATDRIAELLAVARDSAVPVFFSRGGKSYYTSGGVSLSDCERGGWIKQHPVRDEPPEAAERALEIAPQLAPRDDEPVVTKSAPSPFFKSMLSTYLASHGVDTVVVTGIHTSACIRAAVTDAFSHNYWVVLPEECVADRRPEAHEYHLAELDGKYADVVALSDVTAYLRDGTETRPNAESDR